MLFQKEFGQTFILLFIHRIQQYEKNYDAQGQSTVSCACAEGARPPSLTRNLRSRGVAGVVAERLIDAEHLRTAVPLLYDIENHRPDK